MKKATLLTLFLLCLGQIWAQMPLRPKKYTPVNDFARVLSKTEKEKLSTLLFQHEKTANEQFVFVTVANMGSETVENFAQQLYNGWGIGKKGNGALVLIAMAERKARIQVGTGLENRLTAAIREEILQNQLVPNLKKGEFYQAFLQTAQVLISPQSDNAQNQQPTQVEIVNNEPVYPETETKQSGADWGFYAFMAALFTGFFGLVFIFSKLGRKTSRTNNNYPNKSASYNHNSSTNYVGGVYIDNSINHTYNNDTSSSSSSYDNNSSSYDSNSSSDSSSSSSDWGGGSSDSGSSSDW